MNVSKAVLITGCSSGIGWATAERLTDVGWKSHATARRVEDIAQLEARDCVILPLDVTDEDSMRSTVAEAIEQAISARSPKSRYAVTPSARICLGLRSLLPDRALDVVLRTSYPLPGR